MKKESKLKQYRCHFEISANVFKDVMAFDELDAIEQVEGGRVCASTLEEADFSTIVVDYTEVIKKKTKKKIRKI